jgi:hypothetical protein
LLYQFSVDRAGTWANISPNKEEYNRGAFGEICTLAHHRSHATDVNLWQPATEKSGLDILRFGPVFREECRNAKVLRGFCVVVNKRNELCPVSVRSNQKAISAGEGIKAKSIT